MRVSCATFPQRFCQGPRLERPRHFGSHGRRARLPCLRLWHADALTPRAGLRALAPRQLYSYLSSIFPLWCSISVSFCWFIFYLLQDLKCPAKTRLTPEMNYLGAQRYDAIFWPHGRAIRGSRPHLYKSLLTKRFFARSDAGGPYLTSNTRK